MSKNTSIILVVIIVLAVGGFVFIKNSNQPQAESDLQTQTQDQTQNVQSTPIIKQYTLSEVSTHASASSCWSAVNDGVYDLTSWISKHPGGKEAITGICGKDASSAFNAQHGGQEKPEGTLAGFKIGELK